ncbi:MAG TPA: hypothetical protein PKD49_12895 [Hyphomicrobium sp.]|nr:hypothetical protein [Hyphomicrobium sp.]
MSKSFRKIALVAALACAPIGGVCAAAEELKAAPIIFETQHMNNTAAGDELVYDFARTVSNEELLGKGFKDKITLKVGAVKDGKRSLDLQIYTGERARDLQKMTDMTINPMFIVTMQQAVASFRTVGGGDFAYLKNRFAKNMDQKSSVEKVKIDFKGQTVDAYRIDVEPYKGDPNADRMRGYEISTFEFIISPSVPGELVEALSTIKSSTEGSPSFEERTTLAGYGGVK